MQVGRWSNRKINHPISFPISSQCSSFSKSSKKVSKVTSFTPITKKRFFSLIDESQCKTAPAFAKRCT